MLPLYCIVVITSASGRSFGKRRRGGEHEKHLRAGRIAFLDRFRAVDAAQLARQFGSHIEGAPLGPDLPDLVAFDMPVSWTVSDQNAWREIADEAHRKFESFMMENGVPLHEPAGAGASATPTCSWSGEHSLGDSQAASMARVFDISVMGRPGSDRGDPRMATAEAAIFESGRPVLLAPPKPVSTFGETVVIS